VYISTIFWSAGLTATKAQESRGGFRGSNSQFRVGPGHPPSQRHLPPRNRDPVQEASVVPKSKQTGMRQRVPRTLMQVQLALTYMYIYILFFAILLCLIEVVYLEESSTTLTGCICCMSHILKNFLQLAGNAN